MPRLATLLVLSLAAPALAGCLGTVPAAQGGGAGDPGASPASQGGAGSDGLVLEVDRDRSTIRPGEPATVEYTVRNEGHSTVWYNGDCQGAWRVEVVGPDGETVPRAPTARCLVLAWTPLEPGESVSLERGGSPGLTWNGTAWNGTDEGPRYRIPGDGTHEPVAPGNYTVRGAFLHADERDGNLEPLPGTATIRVEGAGEDHGGGSRDDGGAGGDDGGAGDPEREEGHERGRDPGDAEAEVAVEASANRSAIAPGEAVGVDLVAENVGDAPVDRREGCGFDWEVTVHDASGDEVQVRRPVARCMGYTWTPLEPGETHATSFAWNGTVWNGSAYVDAPEGNYTVQGAFAYDPREGDDVQVERGAATVRVTG